jgi:ribonuclease HI
MELKAAIAALGELKRPSEVEFHTDSEYLRKGITEWVEKWAAKDWMRKGKPIPNADLWKKLVLLSRQHDITWHWVKGHAGDSLNERVDWLAREARLKITPGASGLEDVTRIFVRGLCKGNPGPGGWGVVIEQGLETEQLSGSERRTTNNRMELTATIEGLRLLPVKSEVAVFTISDYMYMGATRWIHGWRNHDWKKRDGKPVSNLDLWQQLDTLLRTHRVRWVNSKGGLGEYKKSLEEAAKLASNAIEMET